VILPSVAVGDTIAVVAQPSPVPGPEDPGGRGEDFGKSSPLGFLVLIIFFIAVAFLIRSMTKHLKRIPESFDKPEESETPKPNGNGSPEPA
jgi:hypothetical protein